MRKDTASIRGLSTSGTSRRKPRSSRTRRRPKRGTSNSKKAMRGIGARSRSASGKRKSARGRKKLNASGGRPRNIISASTKSASDVRRRRRESGTKRRPS